MLRILIADDEVSIIQLIRKLIKPGLPHEIVGEATDGKSALELIEQRHPDIVVTDIRMPGISGIELLRAARERGIPAEFIIISGYKDFCYAKDAIKYGVAEYLLKPIRADELNGALEAIEEKQGEREKLQTRIADMEQAIAQDKARKRREVMASYVRRLAGRAAEEADFACAWEEIFHIQQGIFAVLILKLDVEEAVEESFLSRNLEVLGDKYYRAVREDCFDVEMYCKDTRCYLLMHMEEQKYPGILRKVELLLKDKITPYNLYQVSAAAGSVERSTGRLENVFSSADYAIRQRLVGGRGKLDVCNEKTDFRMPVQLSGEARQQLDHILFDRDETAFREWYDRAYQEARRQFRENPYYLNQFLGAVACYAEAALYARDPQIGEPAGSFCLQVFKRADFCCSNEELYELYGKIVAEQMEKARQMHKDGVSRPIKCMKQYIQGHFAENLLLEEIVGAADLSYSYGSSMFKKETGLTITQYLTQVRMEEAQRLIRETSLTINEVACKVGYTDTRYFSKLFIKTVGIKPVDYRKFYS